MVQQRRGLLRIWNLSLVVAAFSLTILGTFLTRSGVIESVHSFSESTIGPLLLGFFGVVLFTGVGLIAWRGDRLHSPGGIDSPDQPGGRLSGQQPPLRRLRLRRPAGHGVPPPLRGPATTAPRSGWGRRTSTGSSSRSGLALLFLMAVAPALPWRKTTVEVMRGRLAVPAAIGRAGGGGLRAGRGARRGAVAGLRARAPSPPPRPAGPWCCRCGAPTGGPDRRARSGAGPRSPGGGASWVGPTGAWWSTSAWWWWPSGWPPPRRTSTGASSHLSAGQERHVRRPHHRVRGYPGGHHAVALVLRGRSAGGRRRHLLSGRQPVRDGHRHRGHAGHRLQLARRPLPDHRHHPQPARPPRWAFGVVEQPLVMWLWVGAGLIGVRLDPLGHPRAPAAAHRPGLGPGGRGAPRPSPPGTRRRWPAPRTDPRSEADPLPVGAGTRHEPRGGPTDRAGPAAPPAARRPTGTGAPRPGAVTRPGGWRWPCWSSPPG